MDYHYWKNKHIRNLLMLVYSGCHTIACILVLVHVTLTVGLASR